MKKLTETVIEKINIEKPHQDFSNNPFIVKKGMKARELLTKSGYLQQVLVHE